jgi:ABC-2 type transport system permease protein
MSAIYKRELRSYFITAIGYVYLAVFVAIAALIFSYTTLQQYSLDVSTYFTIMLFVMLVTLPLLTMRLFSEERKSRTEQLLMTAPISITSMVLAKFFAALTVFGASVLISSIPYISLFLYGEPQSGIIVGNVIAMFLVGSAFIAVGIFMSSLTENQLAAAISTIGTLLAFMLLGFANGYIDSYAVRSVISWISIFNRYTNFTHGIFDFAALLYYFSISAAFIFFTVRVYERRRWGR